MTISKRRLKEIKAIPDEDINYSDIPELGDNFFRQAEVWMPPEKPKAQLTVRFDADIVDWFRKQGHGYQTRMNAVLRAYMETRRDHESSKP
ncbi:MAG: BrnA antitoxin family protein [Gammaproteobacteria bacterium]